MPRCSPEPPMFAAEEPTRFGTGRLGCRAMSGTCPLDELENLQDMGETSYREQDQLPVCLVHFADEGTGVHCCVHLYCRKPSAGS